MLSGTSVWRRGNPVRRGQPRPDHLPSQGGGCPGNLETDDGRTAIEAFFATTFAKDLRGRPRSCSHGITAFPMSPASGVDHQSGKRCRPRNMVGQSVHPLRFAANLYVAGWPHGMSSRCWADACDWQRAAESHQADRAMRRGERRSDHRAAGPQSAAHMMRHYVTMIAASMPR